jgi:hypothetical protein
MSALGPPLGTRRVRPDADPLPLLADQYFDRLAARASDMPEKRLMLAVLFDAVVQLHRPGSTRAVEVVRWIRSESNSPFAFNSICEAFEIDPMYLARGLLSWRERLADSVQGRFPGRHTRTAKTRIVPFRARRRRKRDDLGTAATPTASRVGQ